MSDDTKVKVEILDPSVKKMKKTPEELIEAALDNPIGTKRLEEMVVPEAMRTVAACRVNMVFRKAVIQRSQQEIPVFRRLRSMQKK